MLELKDIRKSYRTGGSEQLALAGVSVAFRDTEFVAILGPSGSGKTTLLNILGGLDRASSGDLVINGISTEGYRSKDWDTYRNHNIGFVFQSYNLIPHQSILANVELALTLAGEPRAVRRERAIQALERVGLKDHIHKLPSQLSGGQMQRVAIARALVNNPDIVLADEPTGALDGKTGVQIMDLLKEVAQDHLVIMVTHNPELAEAYATRTIRLQDGAIVSDTQPFSAADVLTSTAQLTPLSSSPADKKRAHASMSFRTALALSFNNLMTKKARTFLTAFAGSIGIMGIAAILALSTGVNNYIDDVQKDTMTSYPISLTKMNSNLSEMLEATSGTSYQKASGTGNININQMATKTFASVSKNDLKSARAWIESGTSGIEKYASSISYDWGITPSFYYADPQRGTKELGIATQTRPQESMAWMSTLGLSSSQSGFQELNPDQDLVTAQYNLVAGNWPKSANEAVLVLTTQGEIWDYSLYQIGVLDQDEFSNLMKMASTGEEVKTPDLSHTNFSYDDALKLHYKVVEPFNRYSYNDATSTWQDRSQDSTFMTTAIQNGIDVRVVGVIQPKKDANNLLRPGIAYTQALTDKIRADAADSQIVKAQLAHPDIDVFTNTSFDDLAAKQQGFDMSKLFTVDTNKLKEAFQFDSSKLSSALNPSSLSFDLSSLPADKTLALDPSSLQIDPSVLTKAISQDSVEKLLAEAPKPDFASLASSLSSEQQQELQTLAAQLASGFIPWWYEQHPGESLSSSTNLQEDFAAYLQSADALAIQQQMQQIAGTNVASQVQEMLENYQNKQLVPYIQNSLTTLASQAAQALSTSLASQLQAQMAAASGQFSSALSQQISSQLQSSFTNLSASLQGAFSVHPEALAQAIQVNITQDELASLMTNLASSGKQSFDSNLLTLGYAPDDDPQAINIYPKDFEAKTAIYNLIDQRNEQLKASGQDDKVLSYNDLMGVLLGSVTTIINAISTVLIAFVSISLVVSSIMIGVITYISVLERKKEIGILRAMGASRRNIANVFNAETFIEGLLSGVLAITVVELVSIPINYVVESQLNVPQVMNLSPLSAVILIAISVLLTLVAGLIPASSASRRDPVEALRSE